MPVQNPNLLHYTRFKKIYPIKYFFAEVINILVLIIFQTQSEINLEESGTISVFDKPLSIDNPMDGEH